MKNVFKVFGTYSRWLCALALSAVIGFSFAACSNGSTDVVIPPEWQGTYTNGGDSVVVTAATITTLNGDVCTVRSDEGISGNVHKYNFKIPGNIFLLSVYFYDDKNPVYLKLGEVPIEYAKQP